MGTFMKYDRLPKPSEMRQHVVGEDMSGISVSDVDKEAVKLPGGFVARNPKNHSDQWYINKTYFKDNFDPNSARPVD